MRVRAAGVPGLRSWLCGAALLVCAAAASAQTSGGIEGLPEQAPAVHAESVVRFPQSAPADDSSLLPVPLPAGSELRFFVDPASVTRTDISNVRYTLVVRVPSGLRNISYEGLDCASDTWRVYATWSASGGRWVANASVAPLRLDTTSNSDVHGVLDRDYWCDGHWAAGDAPKLVERLRKGLKPGFVHP